MLLGRKGPRQNLHQSQQEPNNESVKDAPRKNRAAIKPEAL